MKRIIIILALLFITSISSHAQLFNEYPDSSHDENGKAIKSGYITNSWYDNWVVFANGGVNSTFAKINENICTTTFDISVAKWAMPALAFRFGVQAGQGKEKLPGGYSPHLMNHPPFPFEKSTMTLSWDYFYAHADALWCATNTFLGYKFNRFWNISPYLHGGYQRMFDPDARKVNYEHEAVFGAGILNSFRITDRIKLNVDFRASSFSGRYHSDNGQPVVNLSALAGLSFSILKPGWKRAYEIEKSKDSAIASEAATLAALATEQANERELASQNDALRYQNDALMNEMNALKTLVSQIREAAPYNDDELLLRIAEAGLVVYYEMGKDNIRECEELYISKYVETVLSQNPDHVFYLTGSADKGTGSEATNKRLSSSRVNNVKRYLVNDLKVSPEKVVIKKTIISDQHDDARLDRCVLFENE